MIYSSFLFINSHASRFWVNQFTTVIQNLEFCNYLQLFGGSSKLTLTNTSGSNSLIQEKSTICIGTNICCRHFWFPDLKKQKKKPDGFSFQRWCWNFFFSEMSWQLLDGLPWYLVQITLVTVVSIIPALHHHVSMLQRSTNGRTRLHLTHVILRRNAYMWSNGLI